MHTMSSEGFEVGLDARATAGIRTGNGHYGSAARIGHMQYIIRG
jgi:hypothetical protein